MIRKIALTLLLACAARAEDTVFRVTTSLVQTDVEVVDGKGRHINNLKPGDFEVLLDGKPQPVTNLSWVDLNSPSINDAALGPPTPAGERPVIQPENVRRSMVIVVDDLEVSFAEMVYLRKGLRKFVDESMLPGDLVALWQVGRSNTVYQQFTTDKSMMEAAIENLRWNPRSDMGWDATTATLETLDLLMDELRGTGGRKAVVLFDSGMRNLWDMDPRPAYLPRGDPFASARREMMKRLTDKANRAGVVIHTIDARGLIEVPPALLLGLWLSQQGMKQLAERTGGIAVTDTNGLAEAMENVEEDQKGYYLIGFRAPDRLVTDANAKKLAYYSIRVRVNVKGLHVRSREGFLGRTDEAARPKKPAPVMQMLLAMYSLYNRSGLGVRLTPLYTIAADGKPLVHNLLYIDLRGVTFHRDILGKNKAELDLIVQAESFGSGEIARDHRLVIQGDDRQVKQLRERGVLFTMDVPVKHAGPYRVHATVRDRASEAVGSVGEYLEIPDVKKQHIAVTTPQLADSVNDLSPALRVFPGESQVLFHFAIATDGGNPHATIQLYKDGKQVLESAVPVSNGVAKGALKLNGALPSGDYYLKAQAIDASASPARTASSWTDFRIAP